MSTSRLDRAASYARLLAIAALQSLKRVVKQAIGRPHHASDIERFCSRHRSHLLRFQPIRKLTVTDHVASEGAGSKALMVMYTISLCRAHGLQYVHTPFRNLAHCEGDQAQWDARWEACFNLGHSETPVGEAAHEAFDYFQLNYLEHASGRRWLRYLEPSLPPDRAVYYFDNPAETGTADWLGHQERFGRLLAPNLEEFRERHRAARPRQLRDRFTVCLHIRRGDVTPAREDMWSDVPAYARTLAIVSGALETLGIAPRIELVSDGDPADFAELEAFSPHLIVREDAQQSLRRLIDADILITAKSCFSYVAALLSDGVIVHDAGYLPSQDGWITRGGDGKFDRQALLDELVASRHRIS